MTTHFGETTSGRAKRQLWHRRSGHAVEHVDRVANGLAGWGADTGATEAAMGE